MKSHENFGFIVIVERVIMIIQANIIVIKSFS